MNKEYLFNKIEKFIDKLKFDYNNNIISEFKYELMLIEIDNLVKNLDTTDLLISAVKFESMKITYIIMKQED